MTSQRIFISARLNKAATLHAISEGTAEASSALQSAQQFSISEINQMSATTKGR